MLRRRVVAFGVDAEDERRVFVLRRLRDDHLLDAVVQVLAREVSICEEASGLHDDLDADAAPGDLRWLALGEHGNRLAIDDEPAVADFDRARVAAVVRVVFQQVRVGLRIDKIVDGDDFKLIAMSLLDRLQYLPSDAAEAVDADFRDHVVVLSSSAGRRSRLRRSQYLLIVTLSVQTG